MKVGDLVRSKYNHRTKAIVMYAENSAVAPDMLKCHIYWICGRHKGKKSWYHSEDLEIFSESR